MPKVNQIDKAIASLEADIAVLNKAIEKLRAQQQQRHPLPVVRTRKPKKADKGPTAGQPVGSDNGE